MNTLIIALVAAILLATLVILFAERLRRPQNLVALANIAGGTWLGKKSYYSDAAISSRNLLGKVGTDDRHVAICGVSDIPTGVITDEASAAEELVNVDLFGCHSETALGVASGAIEEGDLLVPGASGAVRKLPATSGTYYIIGRALKDAADGDLDVQYAPSFPVQRVVS